MNCSTANLNRMKMKRSKLEMNHQMLNNLETKEIACFLISYSNKEGNLRDWVNRWDCELILFLIIWIVREFVIKQSNQRKGMYSWIILRDGLLWCNTWVLRFLGTTMIFQTKIINHKITIKHPDLLLE